MSDSESSGGLPSLARMRAERDADHGLGGANFGGGKGQVWLWVVLGLIVFGILYWKIAQGELESQKAAVRARQRAILQTLGPRIFPFRDQVEGWVTGLAEAAPTSLGRVADGADLEAVKQGPGVYLRLRMKNARKVEDLREAAARSLHDGFAGCFFLRKEPKAGKECSSISDCGPGLLCNEWKVCVTPTQPFNLRLAYRALRVLSPEWSDELQEAGNDLEVRVFDLDLGAASKNDVPLAIDLLASARYFTAVLDEEPKEPLPPALVRSKEEEQETVEERLQRTPHWARVGVWDLRNNVPIVTYRALADARFVPVGGKVVQDAETVAAQQRQVNNCALALEVRQHVAEHRGGSEAGATRAGHVGADAGVAAGPPGAADAGARALSQP